MLDISEITYFQYINTFCLVITTFDHPLHIRPILEILAQCASWRGFGGFGITVWGHRVRLSSYCHSTRGVNQL